MKFDSVIKLALILTAVLYHPVMTAKEETADLKSCPSEQYKHIPNKLMHYDEYFGYDDLYYVPSSQSYKTEFMINDERIITKQQSIDRYEGSYSVDKFVNQDENIILLRTFYAYGLEYSNERIMFYTMDNDMLTYRGDVDFASSDMNDYEEMMGNRSIIPKNMQDFFSSIQLFSDDKTICITVTNFMKNKTESFVVKR